MIIQNIKDIITQMEADDKAGNVKSSKFVNVSMREDIDKTEAYLNSKHTSGEKDYLGREKPFFNIVIAARNIWFRATDIDRKSIIITASKLAHTTFSFMATLLLQKWMRKNFFGQFLNDWGLSLANHGSTPLKFIEKDGELFSKVIDWNNFLCDQIDFENNPKIEKLWFTPAQLLKQDYDKDLVKKLLDNLAPRTTMDGQSKDSKDNYILVYEVHGELPLSLLTGDDDDKDEYVQQMHVVSLQERKDKGDEYEAYCLYLGKESRDPYLLTHLIKKDGQTYSGGAVKNLFEAQWMANHSVKQIKDQLDLASKIVFQTPDGNFVGQNALTNIETGDILTHKINEPLTQLNNKADISAIMSFKADWQAIGSQINGISEAMAGQNAPSGTAWRQVQALLQESHSLFELMTENKGLALEEMLRKFIVPFVKKQMDNTDEIAEILSDSQIKWIDSRYLPNQVISRVNDIKKQTILSGQIYDTANEPMDAQMAQIGVQQNLDQMGNQRFLKPSDIDETTWKEALKDLEWELDIDITGENKDKQGAMATLTTVLQTIANPATAAVLQTPEGKIVFSKILELSGTVSPLELSQMPKAQPMAQPAQPMQPINQPSPAMA
jgi:hypothetical protein